MPSLKNFIDQIRKDEGLSLSPYKDSHGWSIGYGHFSDEKPEGNITRQQAEKYLEEDAKKADRDAQHFVGTDVWNTLPEDKKDIVRNMSYNLGYGRLSGFKKFREKLRAGDYRGAAEEMKDSKWYGQVGNRAKRLTLGMYNPSGVENVSPSLLVAGTAPMALTALQQLEFDAYKAENPNFTEKDYLDLKRRSDPMYRGALDALRKNAERPEDPNPARYKTRWGGTTPREPMTPGQAQRHWDVGGDTRFNLKDRGVRKTPPLNRYLEEAKNMLATKREQLARLGDKLPRPSLDALRREVSYLAEVVKNPRILASPKVLGPAGVAVETALMPSELGDSTLYKGEEQPKDPSGGIFLPAGPEFDQYREQERAKIAAERPPMEITVGRPDHWTDEEPSTEELEALMEEPVRVGGWGSLDWGDDSIEQYQYPSIFGR